MSCMSGWRGRRERKAMKSEILVNEAHAGGSTGEVESRGGDKRGECGEYSDCRDGSRDGYHRAGVEGGAEREDLGEEEGS